MKTLLKIFMIMLMVISISSCTGGSAPAEKETDIAGKAYYETADSFETQDPSEVWFGKDGSFVMKDSYFDGYFEISGKWTIEKGVVTLQAENNSKYDKIIFEVKDDDNLVLKTSLTGSNSDTVFSTG